MKIGKRIRRGTFERLQLAVGQDPSILAIPATLAGHPGCPESYLIDLGLTAADLKRLETYGIARRGYTPNYWGIRDTLPNGRISDAHYRGHGMRKRWVIVAGDYENG